MRKIFCAILLKGCKNFYTMDQSVIARRVATILSKSRNEAGVSQDYMAVELGISRATVANWEKGTSKCDVVQLIQWFNALGKNPVSAFFEIGTPVDLPADFKSEDDEQITNDLITLITSLSTRQKQNIIYLLSGKFQGDPFAMIQLFLAHAHLPMNYRFSIANNISETYKMCEHAGTLKDTENVMPNIEELDAAIQLGRDAAIHNKDGY